MSDAIDVAGLRKSYGKVTALDGLDLSVATGEVHGFLGPNGAGKTTTLRVLLGLVHADGGAVTLLGGEPRRDATTLHRPPPLGAGGRAAGAHPLRRRDDRPARPPPRRPRPGPPGRAARPVRAR